MACMKQRGITILSTGLLTIGIATTAQAIDLSESVNVTSSAETTWNTISDFCSIQAWHPVIAACEQFDQGDATMRKLTTGDGGELLEQLITLDTTARSMTYAIVESPLPVTNYISTIAVTEGAQGTTVTWSSTFDAAGVTDDEAHKIMTGVYKAGLDALAAKLNQ